MISCLKKFITLLILFYFNPLKLKQIDKLLKLKGLLRGKAIEKTLGREKTLKDQIQGGQKWLLTLHLNLKDLNLRIL